MKHLTRIIKNWKIDSGTKRVIQYKYWPKEKKLTLYTSQPGLLIGLHGTLIDKYTETLKKETYPEIKKVELVETEYYWV